MVQLLSYQSALIELVVLANSGIVTVSSSVSWPEISSEEHESSIFRQSSNPVSGFSMMEHVRFCAAWPTENWLGSSMNHIQGWKTVWECCRHALEKWCLIATATISPPEVIDVTLLAFLVKEGGKASISFSMPSHVTGLCRIPRGRLWEQISRLRIALLDRMDMF